MKLTITNCQERKKIMRKRHYFIAIPIPPEIALQFEMGRKEVAQAFPFRTWVHKDDYHITLAFLGEASLIQLDEVRKLIGKIIKNHQSFYLTLGDMNTFGEPLSPRILWKGVREEPLLCVLQQDVYDACTRIGFTLDKRPFKPHITLARKWQGEGQFNIEKIDRIFKNTEQIISFLADRIVLYETHLERLPKYEPLFTWYLPS